MRKLALVGIFVSLFCTSVLSHEHWIDLEEFYPLPGEKTIISICTGHYFPKSTLALSERLLYDTRVISPDGERYTYETKDEKNRRVAGLVFKSAGIHLISFSLKKPPMKEPLYFAKSIVLVKEKGGNGVSYALGCQMEIVPGKDIFTLEKGEELPLRLLYNGKPATSTFSISVDGKKNFFLRTNKNGLALLKVTSPGRYLITAHYKGKGCSLTFCIREFEN